MPRKFKKFGIKGGYRGFQGYITDPRARFFAALACDQRIEILKLLRKGEKCTCELAPHLRVDISVLSRHLAILKSLGLITSRKEGVRSYYSVTDKRIFDILDMAAEILKSISERQQEIFAQL